MITIRFTYTEDDFISALRAIPFSRQIAALPQFTFGLPLLAIGGMFSLMEWPTPGAATLCLVTFGVILVLLGWRYPVTQGRQMFRCPT